jgi:hypothetical protein
MAKTSLNNDYGFPLDRGILTPRPAGLTEEQYLIHALKEGYKLLAAENDDHNPPNDSVKKPKTDSVKEQTSKLQDSLALKSTNPYIKAQAQVLIKMLPSYRKEIESMIRGDIPKDKRYDKFLQEVTELGDKLSGLN